MTTPRHTFGLAEQIKQHLPKDFLPIRAAGSRMYSVDEAMQFVDRIAQALDHTERFPIRTHTIRNPD